MIIDSAIRSMLETKSLRPLDSTSNSSGLSIEREM